MQRFNFKPSFSLASLLLLGLALSFFQSPLASASELVFPRNQLISDLQKWQKTTQERTDLEAREQDLRLLMISRLTFQTERKYQESNLQKFFSDTFKEMAETDQLTANQSFGGSDDFYLNISAAISELMERRENPLDFLRAFTEFSGISEPATLEEFADTRQYYDGYGMYKATPLNLDEAADWIDAREKARLALPVSLEFEGDLQKDFQPEVLPTAETLPEAEAVPTDLILQNSSNPKDDSSRP